MENKETSSNKWVAFMPLVLVVGVLAIILTSKK